MGNGKFLRKVFNFFAKTQGGGSFHFIPPLDVAGASRCLGFWDEKRGGPPKGRDKKKQKKKLRDKPGVAQKTPRGGGGHPALQRGGGALTFH